MKKITEEQKAEKEYVKYYSQYESMYEKWINGEITNSVWEKFENKLFEAQEKYDKKIEK